MVERIHRGTRADRPEGADSRPRNEATLVHTKIFTYDHIRADRSGMGGPQETLPAQEPVHLPDGRGARQLGRGNREQQRFVVNGSGSRPRPSCRRGTLLFRLVLDVLDEFSEEWLAIRVARKLKAIDMIDVLPDLFILRGRFRSQQLVNALGDGALHIGARFVVGTSSILN
jgi:hypothetical protein